MWGAEGGEQFVQDLWYGGLTDDPEGPLEIQRILDAVFAELARRAQHVDLADLLLRHPIPLRSAFSRTFSLSIFLYPLLAGQTPRRSAGAGCALAA